jgi:UDP-galactopyranose mutase
LQINYPSAKVPYTRSVEIKHITLQNHPSSTISYEYPQEAGEPYYPVPSPSNQRKYLEYKKLAEIETRERSVFFGGRLAEYTYINTDQAILRGLQLAEKIVQKLNKSL